MFTVSLGLESMVALPALVQQTCSMAIEQLDICLLYQQSSVSNLSCNIFHINLLVQCLYKSFTIPAQAQGPSGPWAQVGTGPKWAPAQAQVGPGGPGPKLAHAQVEPEPTWAQPHGATLDCHIV